VAYLEVSVRVGNLVEGGPLANTQKKVEKWNCIPMRISIPKLEVTGKQSKKLPKNAKCNKPLKIKRILNTEI